MLLHWVKCEQARPERVSLCETRFLGVNHVMSTIYMFKKSDVFSRKIQIQRKQLRTLLLVIIFIMTLMEENKMLLA